jgi:2-methylisocitrate lyase-like PEP mutase family enzyme
MNTAFEPDVSVDGKVSSLQDKADRLRALHHAGKILVIPNAWDAASAKAFENAGFHAIATTSTGIAAVRRIAASVDVPVTAEGIQEPVQDIIQAGAVGLNLEDGSSGGAVSLVQTSHQVEKIRAVREAGDAAGVSLVINAGTDVYLRNPCDTPRNRFRHAVHRGNAYLQAGADCVFIPGVTDYETIRDLVAEIHGPVGIPAVTGTLSVTELANLGVRRVSVR